MPRRSPEEAKAEVLAQEYAAKRQMSGEEIGLLMATLDRVIDELKLRGLWPGENAKTEPIDRQYVSASDAFQSAKSIAYRVRSAGKEDYFE